MKSFKMTTAALLGGMMMVGSAQGALVGLWEFEDGGDLNAATIGADLTQTLTTGANTGTVSAVAGSGGPDTGAAQATLGAYFTMTHGIAPNGGGSFVNEYTLVMDISYPQASTGSWMSFYQTNTTNSNDGEGFIRADNQAIGVGATGYSTNTTVADTWYRVVFTMDGGTAHTTYVDGVEWVPASVQSLDGRFTLDPIMHILADDNGDDATMNLSNLAIFDTTLSANEVTALGGAGRVIVPEPGSLALLGLGGLLIARRRRA